MHAGLLCRSVPTDPLVKLALSTASSSEDVRLLLDAFTLVEAHAFKDPPFVPDRAAACTSRPAA